MAVYFKTTTPPNSFDFLHKRWAMKFWSNLTKCTYSCMCILEQIYYKITQSLPFRPKLQCRSHAFSLNARYEIEELFSPNQKTQNMKIGVEAIVNWYYVVVPKIQIN